VSGVEEGPPTDGGKKRKRKNTTQDDSVEAEIDINDYIPQPVLNNPNLFDDPPQPFQYLSDPEEIREAIMNELMSRLEEGIVEEDGFSFDTNAEQLKSLEGRLNGSQEEWQNQSITMAEVSWH
jgi:hypothetical protein